MRTLAVSLAFCAALAAQPADDLDHLFHPRQWFELRAAITDRSPSLMRAAVATAFNDPETAERLLGDVIRSAPRRPSGLAYFVGTTRFSSSNQLMMIRSSDAVDAPVASAPTRPINLPSGMMS